MRITAVLAILLLALVTAPGFEARQAGIGSQGDNGCACHGSATSATVITIDGLPETFNASEEYEFTMTITNDDVVGTADQSGGFRVYVVDGVGTLESLDGSQELEGGLTHIPWIRMANAVGRSSGLLLLTIPQSQISSSMETRLMATALLAMMTIGILWK